MSGFFAYTGNNSAKEILISGIEQLYSAEDKAAGITLMENDGFCELKVNAPPCELENKQLESDSRTGIAKCTDEGRCVFSSLTAPPAANGFFAAATNGEIYNFNSLKRIYQSQMPILSEDDLLLACLSAFKEENKTQLTQKISELFFANPSFAFISADEDAIYCRSGILKLIIGISPGGVFLSTELGALAPFCEKYAVLECGENARLSRDKITVFDSKQRKIKKTFVSLPAQSIRESSRAHFDDVYLAPLAIKEIYRRFVCNQQFRFDYLKLKSRYVSKINKIVLIGSSSSRNATRCAKSIFEGYCSLCVLSLEAYEFLCSKTPIDKNTLVIALSEKGEDKNTILAIRKAKERGAKTVGVTADTLSAIARESDMLICPSAYSDCGIHPLTDFISEYFSLCLFALYLGYETDIISELYLGVSLKMAEMLSGILSAALKGSVKHEKAASLLSDSASVFVCSPDSDNSLSFAAAEIIRNETEKSTYAPSLFELEEYPPPLLKDSTVFTLITDKENYIKTLGSIIRIKNRGANIVLITGEGIRQEIEEFENVISFNDSLPAFNPIPCIASVYTIAKAVNDK